MILVEIRPKGAKTTTVALHAGLTVLRGLDDVTRGVWGHDLAKALQGAPVPDLEVEVEVDGTRQVLTSALAERLGLASDCQVTVFALDLPGATAGAPVEEAATVPASPAIDAAEARLTEARKRLAAAEQVATTAGAELERAQAAAEADGDVADTVKALEAALQVARASTAAARRELTDVEARLARAREETAGRAEFRAEVERLQHERSTLDATRSELVGRMIETGDPGDPLDVEEALNGLRRLQSVKPKPSPRAQEVADEWREARARLAALPQPPQPPEWLVAPALEALQEARHAVAEAEGGARVALEIDPALINHLDRAHREVLEAEQRTMKKSSRANRKRLEAAHHAEQNALAGLDAASYGEYLQRIAPNISGGGTTEENFAQAKAALADAEAVWEELHGGQASPEWTEAKQQQAAVRQKALELLGGDVEDADLEGKLRGHLETVVDTAWAEQALLSALRKAGGHHVDEDADLQSEAARWLEESPGLREARAALEVELAEVDARLSVVEEQLTQRQANAFFGDDETAVPNHEGPTPESTIRDRITESETAEQQAENDLQQAREAIVAVEARRSKVGAMESEVTARRHDVDERRSQLQAAEADLEAAKQAAPATTPSPSAGAGGVDLSGVIAMEVEAYLLARVAALRGAQGGPLPLVVDGEVLTGLPERAAKRVYRLLGRLADSMQLVVLGNGEEIATWAEELGDQAAVRTVAR